MTNRSIHNTSAETSPDGVPSVRTSSFNGQLLAKARSLLAGGTLGTLRLGTGLERVIASANGSRLTDVDGQEYVDYILGAGPLILGHAHPAVVEAVENQVRRGTTYYLLNEPAIALAELILAVFPPNSRIRFTSSGSEATFYAMRLARSFTGRDRIIKFAGAYHGHNDYSMFEAFASSWSPGTPPAVGSAGIPRAIAKSVLVAPFNDCKVIETLFESHPEEIAAVIVEPYQRIIEPIDGFLGFLRSITKQYGAILIADEIVTGFRFHYGLAQSLYGVEADLTALGKIIGGGFPVAAVAGREDIMELADHDHRDNERYTYFSGTLNGFAVGAAAGVAVLRELQDSAKYERLNLMGLRLRVALEDQLSQAGHVAKVLGRGPMFHAVFSATNPTSAQDIARANLGMTRALYQEAIKLGVMVNPAQRAYVSVAHSDDDIDYTIQRFGEAVQHLAQTSRHVGVKL